MPLVDVTRSFLSQKAAFIKSSPHLLGLHSRSHIFNLLIRLYPAFLKKKSILFLLAFQLAAVVHTQSLDQLITRKDFVDATPLAQEHIDSDVTSLRAKGYWAMGVIMLSSNPDSAALLLFQADELATDPALRVKVKNALANYYDIIGEPRSSVNTLLATADLIAAEDSIFLASIFNNLSIGYRNLGMFDSAVYFGIRGLEIAKRFDSKQEQKRINNTIAISFAMQGQLEQSKEYFSAALEIAQSMNDSSGIVKYLTNIAQALIYQDSLQEGEQVVRQAASYLSNERNVLEITDQYYLLAEISRESGRDKKALDYLNQSLALLEPTSFVSEKASVQILKGEILLENQRWEQVEQVLSALDQLLNDRDLFDFQLSRLKLERDLLLQRGNLERVGRIQHQLDSLSEEKFDRNQAEIMRDLEVKYQSEQKQQEIESLKQKQQIAELKFNNQRILFGSALGVVLIVALAIYFYILGRQLKAIHQKLLTEQRLLRAQINPHFLFNALAGLHDFIYTGDKWQASEYLASLSKLSREILDYSSREWILLQQEIDVLERYVSLQRLRFPQVSYQLKVDEAIETDNVLIPPMILQPFVENAFEHGFQGRETGLLEVIIKSEGNQLFICIEDDGNGLSVKDSPEHTSKAIAITNERLRLLYQGEIKEVKLSDRSKNDKTKSGTKVTLTILIKEAL